MSIWWSLQLRREAASVPLARRLLVGAMDAAGVDAEISHELSLALTEACANAVQHGGDRQSSFYRVTASIDGDVCRIEVTDSGPGFPANAAVRPAPGTHLEHGRGLCLIEALADCVRYDNQPGSGAVISFDKILKWTRDPSLLRA
jgi:serine/threonine-protein kinase RsbW